MFNREQLESTPTPEEREFAHALPFFVRESWKHYCAVGRQNLHRSHGITRCVVERGGLYPVGPCPCVAEFTDAANGIVAAVGALLKNDPHYRPEAGRSFEEAMVYRFRKHGLTAVYREKRLARCALADPTSIVGKPTWNAMPDDAHRELFRQAVTLPGSLPFNDGEAAIRRLYAEKLSQTGHGLVEHLLPRIPEMLDTVARIADAHLPQVRLCTGQLVAWSVKLFHSWDHVPPRPVTIASGERDEGDRVTGVEIATRDSMVEEAAETAFIVARSGLAAVSPSAARELERRGGDEATPILAVLLTGHLGARHVGADTRAALRVSLSKAAEDDVIAPHVVAAILADTAQLEAVHEALEETATDIDAEGPGA